MKRAKKSLVLGVLAFFGFAGYVFAEESATEAKMELKQVSLFKNGLGFFVWEVTIPEKAKSFYIVPRCRGFARDILGFISAEGRCRKCCCQRSRGKRAG